jgi:AcrR family transcriptional regulator
MLSYDGGVQDAPTRRRRGDELQAALLEAAWDELVEVGYARMTMATVAARARTSEPVLYRRWPNKDGLVLAALEHQRRTHPIATPDTGSLRTDLIEQLTALGQAMAGFYAVAAGASVFGLLADTGMTPMEVREQVLGAQHPPAVRPVYQRAHDRGELDLTTIPAIVLEMPFDLVRHDLVMDLGPVSRERATAIVDDLLLPLVRPPRT